MIQTLLSIPSPSLSFFKLGPLTIHIYALCILTGVFLGYLLARQRFVERGGRADQMESIVTFAVLAGIIGARVYHVITDYQLYFGPGRNPLNALKVWEGGLGIWGGVVFGALAVWLYCRRHKLNFPAMADVLAPSILLAQGIGRLGNWFNQELFGRPTNLPWALKIDAAHRPEGYENFATFHPAFLYELLWAMLGVAFLLWVERKFALGRGKLFVLYVVWYTAGRFFIEGLRIDPVNTPGGFRVNEYVSVIVFLAAAVALVWMLKRRPGRVEKPFAEDTDAEGEVGEADSVDQESAADPVEATEPETEDPKPDKAAD